MPPAVEVRSLNHWTTREVPDNCPCLLEQKMNLMKISLFLGLSFEETQSQTWDPIQCLSRLWKSSWSGSPDFNYLWILSDQVPHTPDSMAELPETDQSPLSGAQALPARLDCSKGHHCVPAPVPAAHQGPSSPCSCPFRPVPSRAHLTCWGRKCWLVRLEWVKEGKGYITQDLLLSQIQREDKC